MRPNKFIKKRQSTEQELWRCSCVKHTYDAAGNKNSSFHFGKNILSKQEISASLVSKIYIALKKKRKKKML